VAPDALGGGFVKAEIGEHRRFALLGFTHSHNLKVIFGGRRRITYEENARHSITKHPHWHDGRVSHLVFSPAGSSGLDAENLFESLLEETLPPLTPKQN
jgi:hypothetical protein